MDPLTIATGVVSLIVGCFKGLDLVSQYATEVKQAELKALELRIECSTIQLALRRLRNQIQRSNPLSEDEEEFRDIFKSCNLVFGLLYKGLEPVLRANEAGEKGRASLRSRIAGLRYGHDAASLLNAMRSLTPALLLLLTAVQHESNVDRQRILKSEGMKEQLGHMSSDTASLGNGTINGVGAGDDSQHAEESSSSMDGHHAEFLMTNMERKQPNFAPLLQKQRGYAGESPTGHSSRQIPQNQKRESKLGRWLSVGSKASGRSEGPPESYEELVVPRKQKAEGITGEDVRKIRDMLRESVCLQMEVDGMEFVGPEQDGVRKEKAQQAREIRMEMCSVVAEWQVSLKGLANHELERLASDPSTPPEAVYVAIGHVLNEEIKSPLISGIGLHRYHV